MTNIELVQAPVIKHKLQEIGEKVTKRLNELQLETLVATEGTVKGLKNLRADLNKELSDFEAQRKAIKEAIANPYSEFEAVYKSEIAEKYKAGIDLLKDKIDTVETKIKDEKKANLITYFNELVASEKIDFLMFEQLGLEINLSTTEKKYKEQINSIVSKISEDLELIKTQEFQAEILVDYKLSLNVSLSINGVVERKKKEAEEAERLRIREKNRRIDLIRALGLVFLDITNAYEFNADIYITVADIEALSKSDFQTRLLEIEANIKEVERLKILAKKETEQLEQQIETPVEQPEQTQPLSAPVEEVKEELVKARFEVTGTMSQLRNLGAYMKANGIIYTNIQ